VVGISSSVACHLDVPYSVTWPPALTLPLASVVTYERPVFGLSLLVLPMRGGGRLRFGASGSLWA
jgi:hypothetical protein